MVIRRDSQNCLKLLRVTQVEWIRRDSVSVHSYHSVATNKCSFGPQCSVALRRLLVSHNADRKFVVARVYQSGKQIKFIGVGIRAFRAGCLLLSTVRQMCCCGLLYSQNILKNILHDIYKLRFHCMERYMIVCCLSFA